ncbi:MAG: hypothetical protein M8865_03315 [marine benthic group bacterium]|nr:hypothetical protein [Gemmatimonadota bacterium]
MGSISSSSVTARHRALIAAVAIPTGLLFASEAPAQQSTLDGPEDAAPIDRWLVSSPFPADDLADESRLAGPGEEGILPDRGREQAGASWTLVRRDGRDSLRLDSLRADRETPAVIYAHSYVRLPADRTMTLTWGAIGDAQAGVWINGRRLQQSGGEPIEAEDERSVRVRLGGGWNTLLFRITELDPAAGLFGLSARLSTVQGGTTIRIQASRPPGEIRTGPEPWVIAAPELRSSGQVAWQEEELLGEAVLEVTAWSRAPVDTVRVRLRGDGIDVRGGARWLTPGAPAPVGLWIPLDRLARLRGPGGEVELEWADEEVKQRVGGSDLGAAPTAGAEEIRLSGWKVRAVPAGEKPDELGPAGPLPDAAGWMLAGEWKVPEALEGRDLYLDTSATPGDFRIGDRAFGGSDRVPLCSRCRRGEKIEILARSKGAWSSLPPVTGAPEGDPSP